MRIFKDCLEAQKEIQNFYSVGLSCREIGHRYNRHHKTISKLLKSYGIELRSKKLYFNEDFFEIIDNEEKAYWLGFMAADGNIHTRKDHGTKVISLGSAWKDRYHMLRFLISLESVKSLTYNHSHDPPSAHIHLCSKKMFNDLVDKNIVERKSLILEPPKNIPDGLIYHWIRGYFDGDGSVALTAKGKNQINITSTLMVCEFIRDILPLNSRIRTKRNVYSVVIAAKHEIIKFKEFIYKDATIFLERKFNRFIKG